jgi:hypothetical protein
VVVSHFVLCRCTGSATSGDSAALWRRLYARRSLAHSPFARLDLYEHIPPARPRGPRARSSPVGAFLFLYLFIYTLLIYLFFRQIIIKFIISFNY